MGKIIKNIISMVLIVVIAACLTIIGLKQYNYYKDKKAYDELRETYISEVENENGTIDYSQYEKLKDVNSDYKMWINIPNTVVDYPVVQAVDNDFYLKRNFQKEDSISGSIFLDCNNNVFEDKNLILYGHNMRNGSMFAAINKFKEQEEFNNGVIKVIKDNKEYTYELFSVFVSPSSSVNMKNSFSSEEEYIEYLNEMRNKSMFNKESKDYSSIISLYTCSYEYDNARTIVCAGLIE